MISVIIPVLNEAEKVRSVVEFVRRDPLVSEVIVVDDGSVDGTPALATEAGAVVLTSTLLGKGASMEDGMKAARNEIVLYLDGDLTGMRDELVSLMTRPIIDDRADFVKAKFTRRAGRVTTLTARPLLRCFFTELARFEQPLGGIVAARRSLLEKMWFETDYGVDIGLLIDAALAGARIVEVDIGRVEHESQPLEVLGDMAVQVARVIFDRAAKHGRMHMSQVQEVQEIERRMQAQLSLAAQHSARSSRLALLEMEGVLLAERYIVRLAERVQKTAELGRFLYDPGLQPEERTRRIAALFDGAPKELFEQTARDVPLTPGAADTVVGLRRMGYRVGIVTDGYYVASEIIRRRVFADFSIAQLMRFREGIATGRITLTPSMVHPQGCKIHGRCKQNIMLWLVKNMGISPREVLTIGGRQSDVCLLRASGQSVAFRPESQSVADAARHVLHDDLTKVLELAAV